jgi:hypothetical protein
VGCSRSCSLTEAVRSSPRPFSQTASGSLERSGRVPLLVRMGHRLLRVSLSASPARPFSFSCLPSPLALLPLWQLARRAASEQQRNKTTGSSLAHRQAPTASPSPPLSLFLSLSLCRLLCCAVCCVLWCRWAGQRPASRAQKTVRTQASAIGQTKTGECCSGDGGWAADRRACAAQSPSPLAAPQPGPQRRRARRNGKAAPARSAARASRGLVRGLSTVSVRLLVYLASLPAAPLPAFLRLASSCT